MGRPRRLAAFAALAAAALAADAGMGRTRLDPFPRLAELVPGPYVLQDAGAAAAGLRAAAADLAWIQLLQYAAGNLPGPPDPPGRPYDRLAPLALRVFRLDPSFTRAPLYAAGMLGWFAPIDRPEEAAALLEEGIRRAPREKLFGLYLAALAYKKKGDDPRMLELLESAFDDPATPSVLRTILGNAYKARGEYGKAASVWLRILASDRDRGEHARARLQLAELRRLAARRPQ